MKTMLQKWFSARSRARKERTSAKRHDELRRVLRLETLQKRECFAVELAGYEFDAISGEVAVVLKGTDQNDHVEISWMKGSNLTPFDDKILVKDGQGLYSYVSPYYEGKTNSAAAFTAIKFLGGKGDDSIRFDSQTPIIYSYEKPTPLTLVALGGEGNDHLEGGSGNDVLLGGEDDDVLIGGLSSGFGKTKDVLKGGDGNDVLFGDFTEPAEYVMPLNPTPPLVDGGYSMEDMLDGGNGNDSIYTGKARILKYLDPKYKDMPILPTRESEPADSTGVDIAIGGLGNDTIIAEQYAELYGDLDSVQSSLRPDLAKLGGKDVITSYSWIGSLIVGGAGDDSIRGSYGEDQIYGDSKNTDSLVEVGNDIIYGDHQLSGKRDHIYGGRGNDVIYGGLGNDKLFGNDGVDWLYGELGNDMLEGGAMNDQLFGNAGADILYGNAGDDTLNGGDDEDYLTGGDGNDALWAGAGNDFLFGDKGNDKLYGMSGNDLLNGGDDNDELYGGTDDDELYGEGGTDKLFGEAGNDVLNGGVGLGDLLNGGIGKDKFKKDMLGWINRDAPVDFNSTDDELV